MAAAETGLKTAVAVAAVSALGPALGEYALVLVGGFGGALLALQRVPPMAAWWGPVVYVGQGVVAALLFTSAAATAAAAVLPAAWALSPDALWIPIAAAVAATWRDALELGLRVVRAWTARRGSAGGTGNDNDRGANSD